MRRKLASLELEKLVDELSSGEGSVAALEEELCALREAVERRCRPPDQAPHPPNMLGSTQPSTVDYGDNNHCKITMRPVNRNECTKRQIITR
jgi:hypothetical protein